EKKFDSFSQVEKKTKQNDLVCPAAVLSYLKGSGGDSSVFNDLDLFIAYFYCYNLAIQCLALRVTCGHNKNPSQRKYSQSTSLVTLHGNQLRRTKTLSLLFRPHWGRVYFGIFLCGSLSGVLFLQDSTSMPC
ncbi:mCG1041349, partial [Mus musculus]